MGMNEISYTPEIPSERAKYNECRDCAVRATSVALGIPYHEAHARLKELGRKNRRGCKFWKMAPQLGLELREDLSCMTLAKALPDMASGRFVVRISGHVFAVIDGVVIDMQTPKPGCRIKMVYEA